MLPDQRQEHPNAQVFHGGSALGILQRLNYIQRQEITHMLLTPVQWSMQSHGYAIVDPYLLSQSLFYGIPNANQIFNFSSEQAQRYVSRRIKFAVDPIMYAEHIEAGQDFDFDREDLKTLKQDFFERCKFVQHVHDNKMELIIDAVPNHLDVHCPLINAAQFVHWFKLNGEVMVSQRWIHKFGKIIGEVNLQRINPDAYQCNRAVDPGVVTFIEQFNAAHNADERQRVMDAAFEYYNGIFDSTFDFSAHERPKETEQTRIICGQNCTAMK